jgi:hypothetical protein
MPQKKAAAQKARKATKSPRRKARLVAGDREVDFHAMFKAMEECGERLKDVHRLTRSPAALALRDAVVDAQARLKRRINCQLVMVIGF